MFYFHPFFQNYGAVSEGHFYCVHRGVHAIQFLELTKIGSLKSDRVNWSLSGSEEGVKLS